MADLITDVVEQQAFDQVEKLQKQLEQLLKTFNNLAALGVNLGKLGGGGTSTSGLSELEKIMAKIVATQEKLNVAQSAEAKQLADLTIQLNAVNQANKEYIKNLGVADGSMKGMELKMAALNKEIKLLDLSTTQGAAKFKQMSEEYNKLHATISQHEQSMGNFRRNVGNYASAYNGMSLAISQVAREMPNFAQSVQIGVMSLTNNIGGLIDGYKGLIAENARLAAAGEATIPVWRGIASAVFSWNTLIMLGVTALTYFLPKLMETKKAADESKKSIVDLDRSFVDGVKSVNEIKFAIDEVHKGLRTQKSVVDQYNESIGKLHGSLKTFKQVEDEVINNSEDIIKSYQLRAQAALASDEAAKKSVEARMFAIQAEKDIIDIGSATDDEGNVMSSINRLKENSKYMADYQEWANSQPWNSEKDAYDFIAWKTKQINEEGEVSLKIFKDIGQELDALNTKHGWKPDDKKRKDKAEKGQVSEFDALMNEYKRKKTEIETEFKNPKDGVGMTLEEYYLKTMEMAHGYINKIAGVTTKTEAEREKAKTALTDVTNDIADYFAKIKDHAKLVEINPMDEIAANYFKEFGTNIGGSYSSEDKRQDILTKSAQETAKRWLDDAKDKMKMAVEKWQKEQDEKGKKIEAQGSIILSGLDISTTAVQAAETHIQRLTDAQLTAIDLREQAELDSLERMKMSEKDRTEKRIAIELKYKAQKDKIHHDEVQQLRRMALLQKGIDLAKIATNMWLNITKHSGQPWLIAADIATGAAATAAVLAQPIPQYAKGTDNHKGGAAIVGEEGTELGILPDGKKFLTKNKPTLMNLPAKTKIIPHDQLVQSIYHNALIRMSEMGGVSSTDGMQEALIASVSDLSNKMERIEDAILQKDMTVKLYGDVSKYAHLQRQLR